MNNNFENEQNNFLNNWEKTNEIGHIHERYSNEMKKCRTCTSLRAVRSKSLKEKH